MTSIKTHVIFTSALLLLQFFVRSSNADIYLKLAARNLPNRGEYLNQNGTIKADKMDAYVDVHVNSMWNPISQTTETISNDNSPDWGKIISVTHGHTIVFWVWDEDPGTNPDDSLGTTDYIATVEDLHYLEFNQCYRYSLEHYADYNSGQYLLVKRVANDDYHWGDINCDGIIHKR